MLRGVPVVVVASVKGGAGKTTTSVLLAEAAADGGRQVMLGDVDPQGSAAEWAALATDAGIPLRSAVVEVPARDLARRLSGPAATAELIILDTPNRDLDLLSASLAVADLVVVPSAPTTMDLPRVWPTLDLVAEIDRPAVVLLVKVDARYPNAAADARAVLLEGGARSLLAEVPYWHSLAQAKAGRPRGRQLRVFTAVLDELLSLLPNSKEHL